MVGAGESYIESRICLPTNVKSLSHCRSIIVCICDRRTGAHQVPICGECWALRHGSSFQHVWRQNRDCDHEQPEPGVEVDILHHNDD